MLFINSSISYTPSFEPTLFDQPSCRKFYISRRSRVAGEQGECFFQFFINMLRNDRIFEKTSCSSQYFSIGEFAFSECNHCLCTLKGSDPLVPREQLLYHFTHSLIGSIVCKCILRKSKSHCRDDASVFQFVFEDTITVSKFTFCITQREILSTINSDRFDEANDIFDFATVCSDILKWSGTYCPWNQCQVF